MKKALLILSLVVSLLITGCNSTPEKVTEDKTDSTANELVEVEDTAKASTEEGFTFVLKDTAMQINDDMAKITEALGEPTSYFESNSCAFQGLDKVYTYGSVILRTYPKDGGDYLLSIELRDDSVQTPEGAFIGNTLDEVEALYGTPDDKTATSLIYKKGDSILSFIAKNNEVYAITYSGQ